MIQYLQPLPFTNSTSLHLDSKNEQQYPNNLQPRNYSQQGFSRHLCLVFQGTLARSAITNNRTGIHKFKIRCGILTPYQCMQCNKGYVDCCTLVILQEYFVDYSLPVSLNNFHSCRGTPDSSLDGRCNLQHLAQRFATTHKVLAMLHLAMCRFELPGWDTRLVRSFDTS